MFGMGFTEIVMILIVAILFLGPDKLPEAMVQIAKFIGSVKRTIDEAKSSFEEEVHLKELKEEAMGYRRELDTVKEDISGFKNAMQEPVTQLNSEFSHIKDEFEQQSKYDKDPWGDDDWDDEPKKEKIEDKTTQNSSEVMGFKNLDKKAEKDV